MTCFSTRTCKFGSDEKVSIFCGREKLSQIYNLHFGSLDGRIDVPHLDGGHLIVLTVISICRK